MILEKEEVFGIKYLYFYLPGVAQMDTFHLLHPGVGFLTGSKLHVFHGWSFLQEYLAKSRSRVHIRRGSTLTAYQKRCPSADPWEGKVGSGELSKALVVHQGAEAWLLLSEMTVVFLFFK